MKIADEIGNIYFCSDVYIICTRMDILGFIRGLKLQEIKLACLLPHNRECGTTSKYK
jgi:hypothetical protein